MRNVIAFAFVFAIHAPAYAAAPVSGTWLTDGGKGHVEIGACGAQLCGRITKLIADTNGPPNDRNNPDPKLRNRPLLGLSILSGFREAGDRWKGTIYDPERGKSFRSEMFRNKDGTLTVKGCIAFLCQSQLWKPVR